MSPGKTVVIIGASYAGTGLAQALLTTPHVKIVIINPSDMFYFNIASPRILAKPDAFQPEQYLIPIVEIFANAPTGKIEFIQELAVDIDSNLKTVTLSNKRVVQFDYLVIASGSTTASSEGSNSILAPFKHTGKNDLEASIKASQLKLSSARSIVIGGAGAVGVELAGEMAEVSPDKKAEITLISASWHVLPNLKRSASEKAEAILATKGIELVRACKVVKTTQDSTSRKWTVSLDNGQTMEADVYISTTGVLPNNKFIPSQYLDSRGWVKVDSELRVKGSSSIYAIGDITSHSARLLLKAQEQIPVVSNNLKCDILGTGKRRTYLPNGKIMMIVPVGSSSGTGQMFGMVPWGKLVAMIKGRDFFVSKARDMIGLK